MKTLTHQDLDDLVNGAALWGAGGGGPVSAGRDFADALKKKPPTRLASPDELPDDAWAAISAGVGSPAAAASGFPLDAPTTAWEKLQDLLGSDQPLSYVLPAEIGAANSLLPLLVCADKGLPLVDATGSSRAMPTLPLSAYSLDGVLPGLVVAANSEESLWFEAQSTAATDAALRGIVSSGAFDQDAGTALWTMTGKQVRLGLWGTISRALQTGTAIREAKAAGQDPVAAAVAELDGRVLLRGKVTEVEDTTQGGFDLLTVQVQGGKRTLTALGQNENLLGWLDNQVHPVVIGPDLLCWITPDGEALSNADLKTGQEIVAIAAPATKEERRPKSIALWIALTRPMGFYGDWCPVEKLWG